MLMSQILRWISGPMLWLPWRQNKKQRAEGNHLLRHLPLKVSLWGLAEKPPRISSRHTSVLPSSINIKWLNEGLRSMSNTKWKRCVSHMPSGIAGSFTMQKLLLLTWQVVGDMASWHSCPLPCSMLAEAAPAQGEDPQEHRATIAALLQLGLPGQEGTQMAGWGETGDGLSFPRSGCAWDFPSALAAVPRQLRFPAAGFLSSQTRRHRRGLCQWKRMLGEPRVTAGLPGGRSSPEPPWAWRERDMGMGGTRQGHWV